MFGPDGLYVLEATALRRVGSRPTKRDRSLVDPRARRPPSRCSRRPRLGRVAGDPDERRDVYVVAAPTGPRESTAAATGSLPRSSRAGSSLVRRLPEPGTLTPVTPLLAARAESPAVTAGAEVAGIEPTGRGVPVPLVLKTRGATRPRSPPQSTLQAGFLRRRHQSFGFDCPLGASLSRSGRRRTSR